VVTVRVLDRVRYGDATWPAIGTSARVLVTEAQRLGDAVEVVASQLAELDLAASRFRADSEVCGLASGRWTVVSPLLLAVVRAAVRAARVTGGAVDPTVGGVLTALGYDRDFALVPADGPALGAGVAAGPATGAGVRGVAGRPAPGGGVAAGPAAGAGVAGGATVTVRRVPGWRAVEVDVAAGAVRVPAGVLLDLGATAKAYAADRAAAAAAAVAGCGVLVSLGGDVAVAGEAPPDGWRVQLADDSGAAPDPGRPAVRIRTGGLATSSTAVRRWRRGGVGLHHLIDPLTGLPADSPWRTVSVAAASCLDADTASTATIVLGVRGQDWLTRTGLPARLTGPAAPAAVGGPAGPAGSAAVGGPGGGRLGHVAERVVLVGGWPA
jgi:thiamine biosynthesis lipoprotein